MKAMNKVATRKSKYDKVFKLPVSFDAAIGILANTTPKKKTKKRG